MTRHGTNTKLLKEGCFIQRAHQRLISLYKLGVLLGFLIGVLSASTSEADLATSTSFQIERGVIDVGGGRATSSGFLLEQSVGQAGTGISTSTSFVLRGGFLYFVEPAAPGGATSVPPTPPPTISPGSGGGGGGSGFVLPPIVRREPLPPEVTALCDFNEDGRCNIIDLSILLFFYEKSGAEIARYDLNENKAVDFPDISVMMFYWTG